MSVYVDVNTRSFYTEKFRVMTSSVSECDTKNTDLSKLGSYRISDTAQYENCRRPGVAILDMQMSKVPIISGYVAPLVSSNSWTT
jgi:hypothetical protein